MGDLKPYEEVTDDRYAKEAANNFAPSSPAPGTLALTGPCPRCDVVIQIPIVDEVYKTFRWRTGKAPSGAVQPKTTERVEPVVCTCVEPHPNRPANRTGCGAYWQFRLTLSEQ
jgi:hypothetical protein